MYCVLIIKSFHEGKMYVGMASESNKAVSSAVVVRDGNSIRNKALLLISPTLFMCPFGQTKRLSL